MQLHNIEVVMAVTEVVPNLIWGPDFFGPQEIWASTNLDPKKFGPRMKKPCDDFCARTKFLGAYISQGLKANVSQENQVLCHVLRQFSNVLL